LGPMAMSFVLQRLVMRKAVSVCGGDESLSRVLNVSVVQVRRWINGKDSAPLPVFNQTMRFVNEAYRLKACTLLQIEPLRGGSMADNLKETGKPDDSRINVEQDHELRYWSEKLGVSRDELRKAVQAAGPMVKDVQRHLNR
jgi:hypothetical protein